MRSVLLEPDRAQLRSVDGIRVPRHSREPRLGQLHRALPGRLHQHLHHNQRELSALGNDLALLI